MAPGRQQASQARLQARLIPSLGLYNKSNGLSSSDRTTDSTEDHQVALTGPLPSTFRASVTAKSLTGSSLRTSREPDCTSYE